MDLTPDGEYLYVAASTDNALSVIRTSDNTVIASVTVDEWPWGVAVSPSGEYVYVSNIADDTVSVISTTDNTVADTISVGADPYSLGEFTVEVPDNVFVVLMRLADSLQFIGIIHQHISGAEPERFGSAGLQPVETLNGVHIGIDIKT